MDDLQFPAFLAAGEGSVEQVDERFMGAKKKNMQSAETIALYDRLIASYSEIERKSGEPLHFDQWQHVHHAQSVGSDGATAAGGRAEEICREAQDHSI